MKYQAIQDDSGLVALTALLAIHRIAVDSDQLRHGLGHFHSLDADALVRLAGGIDGVRAKTRTAKPEDLARLPLPALADGPDGWFLIGRMQGDEVLIQRAHQPVEKIDLATLATLWSGTLVLVTTRESAALASKGFDFSWFIPQIVRYRRLIGEVLLITLALNLLGLAAPLFFQSVVDKVLVHGTLSTLSVLTIGFVAVSFWETAFGWLRTRLYSETSQKIDVELGARLFRHLLRLPLSYFESRRVGDTAMRVRQLETIREFLTNASLTVLIDPVFAVVFLAVMALYSIKLFFVAVLAIPAYLAVALLVTGPLRSRLDDKFERGAANNALLVESIAGIQTVKAAAVEPQWQDAWERRLAGYSAANQRVIDLGNTGNNAIQLISKLNMAAILYFGAQAVIAHDLTVGGLVAFNMFAQRVSGPVIRMAQLWQEFQQVRIAVERLGDVLNHRVEPGAGSQTALPAIRGSVTFELPLRRRRPVDARRHRPGRSRRLDARHRRLVGIGQVDADQAAPAALRPRQRPRAGRRGGRRADRSGVAPPPDRRRAAGERVVQPHGAGEYRARQSRAADRQGHGRRRDGRRARVHQPDAARL